MGRRERKGIMRQNKEKKTISPIIVFLALLLGVAVAVFAAVWRKRSGKGKKSDSAQTDKERKTQIKELRSENERRDRASHKIDEKAVQVQKVKPYRPRRRVSAKQIFGRAVAVAVAAALVVTGLYLAPDYSGAHVPTVLAKERESFSGIKQVVEEHNEKDPFVILDVVPGKAYAVVDDKTYDFSLGTIGYLAPGQSPIQKDFVRIFTGEDKADFYSYSDRQKLTKEVIGSGFDGMTYQEAYGGTGVNLKSGGWSMIFDSAEAKHDADGKLTDEVPYPTGRLYARVEQRTDSAAGAGDLPKKNGFDYKLVSSDGLFSSSLMSLMSVNGIYTFAEGGTGDCEVIFKGPEMRTSGYLAEPIRSGTYDDALLGFGDMSDATGLYIVENGVYRYLCTVGELKGIPRPDPGTGDEEKDPDPTPDEEEKDPNPTPNEEEKDPNPTPDDEEKDPNPAPDDEEKDPNPTPGDEEKDPNPAPDDEEKDPNPAPVEEEKDPNPTPDDGEETLPPAGWHLYVNTVMTEPAETEQTDPAEQEKPSEEQEKPSEEQETPSEEQEIPSEKQETPSEEQEIPSEKQETPSIEQEMPEEGTYCVLKFTYVETEQEEFLYQVRDVFPISVGDGAMQPYDSYVLKQGMLQNSLYAMSEEDASDSDSEQPVVGSFEYVGDGKQMFKLTVAKQPSVQKDTQDADEQISWEIDEQADQEIDEQAEIFSVRAEAADSDSAYYGNVEVLNAPVYIKCGGTNKENWLEYYVFNSRPKQDNASDNFAIEVNTVLAGEVTYEMVQEADLVYLEDGTGLYLDNLNKSYIDTEESGNAEDGLRDIEDTVITRLLYEAVESLKPVIVDYGATEDQEGYTGSNYKGSKYQKLAKVFLKQDLTAFYHEMAKGDNLAANILMNADKTKDFPNKTENGNHYVNRNIYVVNGTPLVWEDFPETMVKAVAESGFGEVLAAIRAENVLLPEDERIAEKVSKAMAVQYIINYSLGLIGEYKDLSILELQPTANKENDLIGDPDEAKGRVVLYWQNWQKKDQNGANQQILRSSRMIKTDVTLSSVAAFNSSYQDINADYNMIFIGLDGQRLYRERDKDGELSTVYNNPALNGKVYHAGDSVAGSGASYDANDITEQKKEALLDYLRAGYPIVVENEFFKGKSAKKAEEKDINTKYIADNTQMYAFLKEAISMGRSDQSEETGETGIGLYTIEDVHSSALFAMQLNAMRPKVELRVVNENGEEVSGEEQEISDMIAAKAVPEMPGVYRGSFEYRISSDRMGEDKTYRGSLERHLYFDLNYDGVFAPEEEFFEYQHEEAENGGKISVDFNEISFGIVPWKLEVTDVDNQFRRASIQGCFTISGDDMAAIKVLQVLDDTTNAYANFQEQYDNVKNSMLAYYLRTAEAILKINWKIETVTPDELAKRLDKNGNYLSRWDVVVLGFGESGNPGDAVTAAVNDFITAGGSVVVSSAGASTDKGRLGLSAALLGQAEGLTYGKLGLHSDTKYRYEGINAGMFNKVPSLFLDRVNDGTITKWPYQIDMRTQLGDATEVSMPDYLLDIGSAEEAGQPYTTAWFTLLDSNLSSDNRTGGYSVSPRDGRNNYYVYSKGNVVYVGQSQYPYAYDAPNDKEQEENISKEPEGAGVDECMIFVNALVAAYNGGVHRANVSIVAGFNGINKVESVTVPFDVAFKESGDEKKGILGDTVDVYFRFTDNNIATDKKTTCSFYYKNPGVSEESELLLANDAINTAEFTEFTSPIWSVEENRLVEVSNELVPGKVYRIKAPIVAPLVSLQTGNDTSSQMSQICVLLKSSYRRAQQDMGAISMDSVTLNRAQMFLLE